MDNIDEDYTKSTSRAFEEHNNRAFARHDIKAPASLLPRLMQRLQVAQQNEQFFTTIATITSLQVALDSADEFVRAAAIRRLAQWEGNISSLLVDRLFAALSDSSWMIREAAIFTLDTLQIEVSQEYQMMALLDENEFVREAARITFVDGALKNESEDVQDSRNSGATAKVTPTIQRRGRSRLYRTLHSIDSLFLAIHVTDKRGLFMAGQYAHDENQGNLLEKITFQQRKHRQQTLGIVGTLIAVLVIVSISLSWFAVVQRLPRNAARQTISTLDKPIFTDTEQMNAPQLHWLDGRQITISDPLQTPYMNRWDVHIQYLHQENLFALVAQNPAVSQYGDIQYSWSPDNQYVVNSIAAPDMAPTTTSVPTNYTVTIEVVSVATGQTLITISYHEKIVPSPANDNGKSVTPPNAFISPDDTRLEVGQSDGNITIWSLNTGKQVASYHLDSSPVGYIQWSANSQRLLAQSSSGLVGLWDTTTGREVSSFLPPTYEQMDASGKQYQNMPATPFLSPDGTLMAGVVGANNRVDIWNATTTQLIHSYQQPTNQIAYIDWLSNSKQLSLFTNNTSSVSSNAEIEIWNLATNQIGLHLATPAHNSSPTFSPSSMYVAIESASSKDIAIWNTSTNQQVTTLHNGVTISQNAPTDFGGSAGQIVVWSPDERYVATMSNDRFNPSLNNVIRVWNVTTGKLVMQYHSNSNQVLQVAWSPDSKYLASVSNADTGNMMEVWNAPR